jgi:hypothetical protein
MRYFVATLLTIFFTLTANASNYLQGQWQSSPIEIHTNLAGATNASSDTQLQMWTAIQRAVNEWNTAVGLPVLTLVADTTATGQQENGKNELVFSVQISPNQAFAAQFGYTATSRTNWGRLLEVDIYFNPQKDWEVYDGPLHYDTNNQRVAEMHRVCLHELGHALGFTHPKDDSEQTIMVSKMSNIDQLQPQDYVDARLLAKNLVEYNRPKIKSIRIVGQSLKIKGISNPYYVHSAWLEITGSSKRYRIPNTNTWERTLPMTTNNIRLFYSYGNLVHKRISQHQPPPKKAVDKTSKTLQILNLSQRE